ncbi:MAG: phosphoribosyltransferase [Candidatus Hermodarchaeota archaeon]
MTYYTTCFRKAQVLNSLRLVLKKYKTVKNLYNVIESQWQEDQEHFTYSQFTRYMKGEIPISDKKEDVFIRFLHNQLNLTEDLIQPNIDINLKETPIQVNMNRLLARPELVNLLAFHVINQEHLIGRQFDAILTHPEAVPLAIAFALLLQIPWFSFSFRSPPVRPTRITQYPYLIDQELVSTAYFSMDDDIQKKKLLIISDYIRRGGFIDILFRIVEENKATVHFLIAIVGIGTSWNRFRLELEGNMRVLHFV